MYLDDGNLQLFYEFQELNITEAISYCEERNGYLPTITSKTEVKVIMELRKQT